MTECPIHGCSFEAEEGTPLAAQMLLTWPTDGPLPVDPGTWLCPDCHAANRKARTIEGFHDHRFL